MTVNRTSHLSSRTIKANGAHYTPQALAAFLADVTIRQATFPSGKTIVVLDPACGDGGLLKAIADAATPKARRHMELVGYETDPVAVANAEGNLCNLEVASIHIRTGDFLDVVANQTSYDAGSLFASLASNVEQFDIIISNPPYVRTQVLGAERSQRLASQFGLSGRVDLYHAFVKAISLALRPGGVLGLLTSNRFMLTQAGVSVRESLRRGFDLCDLYDLGDTKLFDAAVLPAILAAKRAPMPSTTRCSFTRIYKVRNGNGEAHPKRTWPSVLDAVRNSAGGIVRTAEGCFSVERGELACTSDHRAHWSLSSPETQAWMANITAHQAFCFGDISQVRVGIKTTADSIFIRDDWDTLPLDVRPELELLKPLITHHIATRWSLSENIKKMVLYPHREGARGSKRTVDLAKYPRARTYLEQHQARLKARKYVIAAGRQWYEIWVPQQPADWSRPKVVYPDISEEPRFFLDLSGAIVNGDCYWITLNEGVAPDYLYLLLAVANSTFATKYYDTVFHNKLYAGRRRFMTQYVRRFPLPAMDRTESQEIVRLTKTTIFKDCDTGLDSRVADKLDTLVWASLGLRPEGVR
ncbi:MAG: N-6 DNA methylase [Planctomycetota bacterium]